MKLSSPTSLLLNLGHAMDHWVIAIFLYTVSVIAGVWGTDWKELTPYAFGASFMFGAGSIVSGKLGDQWGRRNMMFVFFLGMGASCLLIALCQNKWQIGAALTVLAWGTVSRQVRESEQGRFQRLNDRVLADAEARFSSAVQAVYGARAWLAAGEKATAAEWAAYAATMEPFFQKGSSAWATSSASGVARSMRSSSGLGVPTGANQPNQPPVVKPLMPASGKVGTSGSAVERFRPP